MSDPVAVIPHLVSPETAREFASAVGDRATLRRASTPAETRELLPEAAALVTFRLPEDVWTAAGNLRWIQVLSAGVDHLDLDAVADHDVALTNASGVHAEPIAEQVLGYMLTFERRLHEAARNQHRGIWESPGEAGELADRTVGIVGVGAIGSRVAELAAAFGCEVVGTKRDPSEAPDAVDEIYPADEYWELLDRADHLVLACPLTDETRGLIGADELRALSPEAVLVNIARGEVVDQDALVRTLRRGGIAGAALDVFAEEPLPDDSPLWDLSNVVVTPHMAGSTPHYVERCADIFAGNYERFREGGLARFRNRVV